MQQFIEKSAFDWRRGENKRILAKGVAAVAILSRKIDAYGNIISRNPSRCEWDNLQTKTNNRFLKRRVWAS